MSKKLDEAYYAFVRTVDLYGSEGEHPVAGPFSTEAETSQWIRKQKNPKMFSASQATARDVSGLRRYSDYKSGDESVAETTNSRSDWERKQTRDAYYASIPYGLRQQMQMFNSGGQEPPQQYTPTQQEVAPQPISSLGLISTVR